MRSAIPTLLAALALAGCGGAPTEQEQNLSETAQGPEQLAHPQPGEPNFNQPATAQTGAAGEREGIPGATQGPTQPGTDAPAMGDQGSAQGDTTR